ncbi:PREDICTED: BUD13 homolog, partial [Tinamus guttatus]|uniref:BUD13 homolog n=1 Tax=Tinamus guttatus TaxID=94827 RepID=UPI00052EB7C9
RHDSPEPSPLRPRRHDCPDLSPPRRQRHDSPDPSPPRRKRHDSPDLSPPRRQRHDSPDPSPPRRKRHDSPDLSPPRRQRHDSPDVSPLRWKRHDSPEQSPKRGSSAAGKKASKAAQESLSGAVRGEVAQLKRSSSDKASSRQRGNVTPDLSPPRKNRCDSDLEPSPPRKKRPGSPALKKQSRGREANVMTSGVKAGLVSADVLRREQQELRRHERNTKHLEEESQHTETVFRDKSGRKRDLAQERLEQKLRDEAQAERDEQYAHWGRGLAQGRQQQQNVEDAIKEMQKPLARYIDDQDLDRMLREQEREGDPMAEFIKKRKAKESKDKKEKPRYNGPTPPLNRFNIWPGHRWDGVDRSNGFEQQRFARIADRRAVQEMAYKWSVEDM